MVTFVPGPIKVRISRKSGTQYQLVPAMIGQNTGYAYHPVPTGTILFKQAPNALMITEQQGHSSVTGSLLPANAETAEACIAYLVEQAHRQLPSDLLIEQFASKNGKWFNLSDKGDTQCPLTSSL